MNSVDRFLNHLPTKHMQESNYSLEEYLRALWRIVQKRRERALSVQEVYDILNKAAQTEPMPFDSVWLKFDTPPYSFAPFSGQEFRYFENTILFQIADLHRMSEAGTLKLNPVILYGGVDSPSKHRWYNFTVLDYFDCASVGYGNCCVRYSRNDKPTEKIEKLGQSLDSTEMTWRNLADLLEFGRVYE